MSAEIAPAGSAGARRSWWERYVDSPLSVKNISLVYVWAGLFVVFALWIPQSFLAAGTWQSLAAEQAVTMILALAVAIALSTGIFDLSLAAILGAAAIFIAHLMVNLGVSPVPATILTLLGGLLVASISATAVVFFRVNSFIATLGVSSVLGAFIAAVSNNQQIIGLPQSFVRWSTFKLLGIEGAFWIALVMAIVVWYFLEKRPVGRHMYATGGNPEAARLAGVKTNRIIFGTFLASGFIASIAGIVVTSRLATGSPTIGPPYLLPAFAAAFLGSTQVKPGRFNVLGTLIAVYALATSVKGLQLAGAAFWLPELFNGVALVVAVALSVRRRRITAKAAPEPSPTVRPQMSLRDLARAELERLRDSLGETICLASFPESGDGSVIDVAESRRALRVSARVGEPFPRGQMAEVRRKGAGGDAVLEDMHGVVTVAAVVTDLGQPVALLTAAAPSVHLGTESRAEWEDALTDGAARISERLATSRSAVPDVAAATTS